MFFNAGHTWNYITLTKLPLSFLEQSLNYSMPAVEKKCDMTFQSFGKIKFNLLPFMELFYSVFFLY